MDGIGINGMGWYGATNNLSSEIFIRRGHIPNYFYYQRIQNENFIC